MTYLARIDFNRFPKEVSEAASKAMSAEESLVIWYAVTAMLLATVGFLLGRRLYLQIAVQVRVRLLFSKLATLHRLTSEERDLLVRLARIGNLSNPAVLFIRPSLVQSYFTKLEELEGDGVTRSSAPSCLKSIRRKLWDD